MLSLPQQLLAFIVWVIAIFIAIVVHELSHALAADKLGDPTARLSDRLTLNPLKHYDPVGTTLLLVSAFMNAFSGLSVIPIGWAKPVPFDPYNLQNPKKDSAIIAVAGPISNFILAAACAIIIRTPLVEIPFIAIFASTLIMINVSLAIFNLIPIHPLDGSKILFGLLPKDLAIEYDSIMRRYGMFFLILLIIPFGGTAAVSSIITPFVSAILSVLLP